MTEPPHSRPRPRPRPSAAAAAPAIDPPAVDPPAGESVAAAPTRLTRAGRRRAQRRRRWRIVGQGAAAVCVVAGITTYFVVRAPGETPPKHPAGPTPTTVAGTGAQLADPDIATGFVAGTASDVAAITTYDYRTLDDALSNGLAVTTGAYRASYEKAMTGDLAAQARQNHTVQTFDLLRIGIGDISADGHEAKVLIFGREHTTYGVTNTSTTNDLVTLCATMEHTGNRYLISDLVDGGNAGLPPGTSELPVAAEAAREEVVNLLSYRRSDFAVDYARALAGASGQLRDQVMRNAADTHDSLAKGSFDLSGTVTAVAVERAQADSLTLLVAATGSRVDDAGHATPVTDGRYEVTVSKVSGTWTASAVTTVGDS